MEREVIQKQIYELLEKGKQHKKLVNVGSLRSIGKTYTLEKFAKDNGYTVLHFKSNYDLLKGNNDLYVADEDVDYNTLPKWLKERVITGYCNLISIKIENYKDKTFDENVMYFLKYEEESLRGKMEACLKRNDFAMYKTLILSYEKILELIKKYDWELKYSEYKLDSDNGEKQLAIWEQNGDGVIRNHKMWNVEENRTVKIDTPDIKIDKRSLESLISNLEKLSIQYKSN